MIISMIKITFNDYDAENESDDSYLRCDNNLKKIYYLKKIKTFKTKIFHFYNKKSNLYFSLM